MEPLDCCYYQNFSPLIEWPLSAKCILAWYPYEIYSTPIWRIMFHLISSFITMLYLFLNASLLCVIKIVILSKTWWTIGSTANQLKHTHTHKHQIQWWRIDLWQWMTKTSEKQGVVLRYILCIHYIYYYYTWIYDGGAAVFVIIYHRRSCCCRFCCLSHHTLWCRFWSYTHLYFMSLRSIKYSCMNIINLQIKIKTIFFLPAEEFAFTI